MASKIFLPLRLKKWGNFVENKVAIPNTDIIASSITVNGSEGSDLFAIEDGLVQDASNGFILISNEDQKPDDNFEGRVWGYRNATATQKGEVKAGDKIGKVLADKPLLLDVRTDQSVASIGDLSIEIPENPLPALNGLDVTALPQDAEEVTEESDEPGELTAAERKTPGLTLGKGLLIGGGILTGGYILYRIVK